MLMKCYWMFSFLAKISILRSVVIYVDFTKRFDVFITLEVIVEIF